MSSPLDRELGPGDPSPYLPRWARVAVRDQTPSPIAESFEPDPDARWPEEGFVIDGHRAPVSLAPPGTPSHGLANRSMSGRRGLFALAVATLSVVGFSVGISTAPEPTDQHPTSFESRFSGPATDPHPAQRDSGQSSQPTAQLGAPQDSSSTARPALGAPGMEWRRFPPAQDWADRNSLAPATGDMLGQFEQFLRDNVLESSPRDGAEDRNALFRRFLDWQKMQSGGYAGKVPPR